MLDILEFLKDLFMFGGYLADGSDAFPGPLTPEEEADCIKRMADGDPAAREALIEHNLRLVAHIAKKYARGSADMSDYISIGTIGLIKGVNTFDTEKGRLTAYISRCAENEILMFLRSAKRTASEVSLSDPIGEDSDGNQISFLDILPSPDAEIDDQISLKLQAEQLREVFADTLTPRERLVIELRYGLRGDILPQRVIAERLNISRSYVSRIEKKALRKLEKRLSEK